MPGLQVDILTTRALPHFYRATYERVIDGDTIRLEVDTGWNHYSRHNARLLRVDAPEMRGDTLEAGRIARLFVVAWLADHVVHSPLSAEWPFLIHSEKDDSFGRYLVEVWCGDAHNLSDDLLAAGHAVPWTR